MRGMDATVGLDAAFCPRTNHHVWQDVVVICERDGSQRSQGTRLHDGEECCGPRAVDRALLARDAQRPISCLYSKGELEYACIALLYASWFPPLRVAFPTVSLKSTAALQICPEARLELLGDGCALPAMRAMLQLAGWLSRRAPTNRDDDTRLPLLAPQLLAARPADGCCRGTLMLDGRGRGEETERKSEKALFHGSCGCNSSGQSFGTAPPEIFPRAFSHLVFAAAGARWLLQERATREQSRKEPRTSRSAKRYHRKTRQDTAAVHK